MAASKSFGMVLMQNALKAEWNTAAAALECASNASEAFSAPSKSEDFLGAVLDMARRGNRVYTGTIERVVISGETVGVLYPSQNKCSVPSQNKSNIREEVLQRRIIIKARTT